MSGLRASFRDPSGKCFLVGGRVLRVLDSAAGPVCEDFLQTEGAREWTEKGRLVGSRRLVEAEQRELLSDFDFSDEGFTAAGVWEHERIPFASYPYEWAPEMLWEAGSLTLEMARRSLAEGYGLKDATPYNILFRGCRAVFIDLPSFERRSPGDPTWRPYAQFVRTFLLPLLATRLWGVKLADIFITHRDGLEPEEVYRWSSFRQRLLPPLLTVVSIPTWLGGKARSQGPALYQTRELADSEKARFILDSLLKQLERQMTGLRPAARPNSSWSNYMATHSYDGTAFAEKVSFVENCLREFRPKRVLDLGANTGHFSFLAAKQGAEVVAVELDSECAGQIWRQAQRENLNVLPLVMDIGRPSPALGWNNRECPSFLERATGQFDTVIMLAIIHHLLVTERIPLDEILRMAATLTRSTAIIEYVAPQDEMFRQLTRGRDDLHGSLNETVFERACGKYFEILQVLPVPGTKRRLYALKKKGGSI